MNPTKRDNKPKDNNRKRLLRALFTEINDIHSKACDKTDELLGDDQELKFAKAK